MNGVGEMKKKEGTANTSFRYIKQLRLRAGNRIKNAWLV